jgi:hypothetical protein
MSSATARPILRSHLERAPTTLAATVDPDKLAWVALAVGTLAGAALLLYLTRGTTFWFDEWLWIIGRRGSGVDTFLDPHNSHLSLLPVALYKLLFTTVGISHYLPYRLVVTAGHLFVVLLMYVYVERRVGSLLALLAAAVILLLGPGWQEFLWPFQIAWLLAIAFGIAALLMLDRRDRVGDVAACGLITLSLASTSVGVAVALGIVVELWTVRRRLGDAWIIAIPLGLYVLWTLGYQHATVAGDVFSTVGFVAQSSVIAIPALLGLSGTNAIDPTGTLLAFGAPLTVAAGVALVWRSRRRRLWSARASTLIAILLVFWILTGLGRSDLGGPFATRYLYVDAVFCVLLAAELARSVIVKWPLQPILALIAAIAVISNIGVLRSGAGLLRASALDAKAEVGALNLSQRFATSRYVAQSFPGYPFVRVRAADLFAAERSFGTLGDSAAQLAAAPEPAREIADSEMTNIRALRLAAKSNSPPLAAAPTVDASTAGAVAPSASCISFAATAAAAGQQNQLAVTIPRGGVWLSASGAKAAVAVRRFAAAFKPLGTVPAGTAALLRIPTDSISSSWHLQVTSAGRVRVCGLAT